MTDKTSTPLKLGSSYWIIATWSSSGPKVYQCTWKNDYVDQLRLKEKRLFITRDAASSQLRKK